MNPGIDPEFNRGTLVRGLFCAKAPFYAICQYVCFGVTLIYYLFRNVLINCEGIS